MKKGLSALLAASLAFSAFGSVAFAADKELTATEKFEALVKAGIFDKDGDGTGANLEGLTTRAQVAKILVTLLGLKENAAGEKFDDVEAADWYAGYIGALQAAKLVDGVSDNPPLFAPDDNVTIEQFAKLVAIALDLEIDEDAEVEGDVSDWAVGYVAAVVKAGYLAAQEDYTAEATRQVLVESAFDAKTILDAITSQTSATVAQVAGNKLQVTFNKAVDTAAVKFEVKKGTSTINFKPVTFDEAKKVATLEAYSNMAEGDYTVNISGVELAQSSLAIKVAPATLAKIELTSDVIVQKAASGDDSKKATFKYKVIDSYGVDVTSKTNIEAVVPQAISGGIGYEQSSGTITVEFLNAPKYGDIINVSVYEKDKAQVVTNGALKFSAPAHVASLSLGDMKNKDNKVLRVGTNLSTDKFRWEITAKDQYGNDVSGAAGQGLLANENAIRVIKPDNVGVSFVYDSDAKKLYLQLDSKPSTKGTYAITLFLVGPSVTVNTQAVVEDDVAVSSITISAPERIIKGEKVEVPFTALDQYNNPITKYSDLDKVGTENDPISLSTSSGTLEFVQDYATGNAKLILHVPANSTASSAYLAAYVKNKPGMSNVTVTLNKPAEPVRIESVKSDVAVAMTKGGKLELKASNFVIRDQYERAIELKAYADRGTDYSNYRVLLEAVDGTYDKATIDADQSTVYGSVYGASHSAGLKLTAAANGSETVKATLYTAKETDLAKLANNRVANSETQLTVSVIDKKDITEYVIETADVLYSTGEVYADATAEQKAYAKEIKVFGKTSSGTKVSLDAGTVLSIQSTNQSKLVVVTDGGKTYAYAPSDNGGADKESTAGLLAVINGATELSITKSITISTKAKAEQPIATKDSKDVYELTETAVNGMNGAYVSNHHKYETGHTVAAAYFEVKDQYGVPSAAVKPTYYTLSVVDINGKKPSDAGNVYGGGDYEINNTTGQLNFSDAKAGDQITITAFTAGNATKSFKIVVQPNPAS